MERRWRAEASWTDEGSFLGLAGLQDPQWLGLETGAVNGGRQVSVAEDNLAGLDACCKCEWARVLQMSSTSVNASSSCVGMGHWVLLAGQHGGLRKSCQHADMLLTILLEGVNLCNGSLAVTCAGAERSRQCQVNDDCGQGTGDRQNKTAT
jgi:hypothetical protein